MFSAIHSLATPRFDPRSLNPIFFFDANNPSSYIGSGTTVNDLSGNGNPATLVNGPGFTSTNGGAITFDGIDDYIGNATFESGLKLSGVSAFSICMFVKHTSTSCAYFSYSGLSQYGSDILFALSSSTLLAQVNNGVDGSATVPYSVPAGYFHLALIFDGTQTGNSNRLKLYINGALQTLSFDTTIPSVTGSPTTPLFRIGTYGASPSTWYINGSVASTVIFNKALTQNQVSQCFNWGKGRLGI